MRKTLPLLDRSRYSEGIVEKSPVLLLEPQSQHASDLEGGEQ